MKENFDVLLKASIGLWVDYVLCDLGKAFKTETSNFQKVSTKIGGYDAFKCRRNQLVYDESIDGVTVPKAATINGVSTNLHVGQISGSSDNILDYNNGRVLVKKSNAVASVSATYSYKEVEVRFSSLTEAQLVFQDKYASTFRDEEKLPDTEKQTAGPIIYIKYSAGENAPWCLGGVDKTETKARLVFLSQDSYLFDGVCGLFRDQEKKMMSVFPSNLLPFNALGGLKYVNAGLTFDYSAALQANLQANTNLCEVSKVRISEFGEDVNHLIGPEVRGGFIDVNISALRTPRL
jgi:hypothetical protein